MQTSTCTLLLLFTFTTTLLFAQSTDRWVGTHLTFPLNDNVAFIEFSGDFLTISYRIKHTNFAHFGASFRKNRDTGWFHEFSLVNIEVRKEEETDITLYFLDLTSSELKQHSFRLNLHTRYEFGKLFLDSSKNKVLPALSVGIDPYVQYFNVIPRIVDIHGNTLTIGTQVSIIPRLLFKLGENLQLDINAPVPFYEFFVRQDKVFTSSSNGTDRQTTTDLGSYFRVDDIPLRLGLLYRLK
mgnify:CR=1 FL=1